MKVLTRGRQSRRQFVQRLAAASGVGLIGPTRFAHGAAPAAPQALIGPHLDLSIDSVPVTVAGRRCTATAVTGAVPGSILRLREADDAVIRVSHHLREPTSLHWPATTLSDTRVALGLHAWL